MLPSVIIFMITKKAPKNREKNYAATFCVIFLVFTPLCFMHVFCKIFGAIFEKWTFLFFQKCPKSKTANESRMAFF